MGIAEHWRLKDQRLRLEGHVRINGKGVEYRLTGNWIPSTNGYHEGGNLPITVYKSEALPGSNGNQSEKGSIEVAASD